MQQQELTEQQLKRKTEFDVELTEVGPNKVKVIKVVREVTGLGLKEAKDAVDGAPKVIKEQLDKASAEDAKAKLEAEGAKVNLNSRIGYERSKNIKKSQGQILFAPWLFFMFLLRDSRSAS